MVARPAPATDAVAVPPPVPVPSRLPGRDELPCGPTRSRLVEQVDGVLLVSPVGAAPHQRAARRLARALEAACGPSLEVFAPFTLRLESETEVVPDVAVVAVDAPLPRYPRDVRLVAEVLSPGSRRADAALKARVYADAGIPVFLLVDPDAVTLTVHRLHGGGYVEVARAARGGTAEVPDPVPVLLCPAELVRP